MKKFQPATAITVKPSANPGKVVVEYRTPDRVFCRAYVDYHMIMDFAEFFSPYGPTANKN